MTQFIRPDTEDYGYIVETLALDFRPGHFAKCHYCHRYHVLKDLQDLWFAQITEETLWIVCSDCLGEGLWAERLKTSESAKPFWGRLSRELKGRKRDIWGLPD